MSQEIGVDWVGMIFERHGKNGSCGVRSMKSARTLLLLLALIAHCSFRSHDVVDAIKAK